MTLQEIITSLCECGNTFPEKTLQEARNSWDELLPEVDMAMAKCIDGKALSDEETSFLFWGVLLLGDRAEVSRLENLVRFCDQSDEPDTVLDNIFGDAITTELSDLLYILSNGNINLIKGLLTSPQSGDYIKSAVLKIIFYMIEKNEISVDDILPKIDSWIDCMRENTHTFSLSDLGNYLIHHNCGSYQSTYTQLFNDGHIDSMVLPENCIKKWAVSYSCSMSEKVNDSFDIMSVKSWACFNSKDFSANDEPAPFEAIDLFQQGIENNFVASSETYIAPEKLKRNDPCPCGSGKKYKKCCLN